MVPIKMTKFVIFEPVSHFGYRHIPRKDYWIFDIFDWSLTLIVDQTVFPIAKRRLLQTMRRISWN